MSLTITDRVMRSTSSVHTASFDTDTNRWRLSWLPGRVFDRNSATSGMLLADIVAEGLKPGDKRWPALDSFAAELGLSGPEAVVRASTTDEVREHIARAEAQEQAATSQPTEDEQQAFLAAGNTEAQLAARIRDGVPLDREFGPDAQVQLDEHGHGVAWRDAPDAGWQDLSQSSDAGSVADDAVPMTGPEETSPEGVRWSERVDQAVHGFDQVDSIGLDRWMQSHADSSYPHLDEACLVAAWERGEDQVSEPVSGDRWDSRLSEHETGSAAVLADLTVTDENASAADVLD